MGQPAPVRFSERLRLEPITARHAADLWTIHNDDEVAPWYDGWKPSMEEAHERAAFMEQNWRDLGVHKWMAYERSTGRLVGRGGLSRTPVDGDWGQLYAFLPNEPWVHDALEGSSPSVHANWLELGWALRHDFWGNGYASEIGRTALDFAFADLGVRAVVSCTRHDNRRSRAVMERIDLPFAGILKDANGGDDEAVHALIRGDR